MFQLFDFNKFITLAGLLVIMSACGHDNPNIQGNNSKPVKVKVISGVPMATPEGKTYSGTLEAGSSTALSFSVAGTISRIHVSEGQHVGKGELIASVDGSSLKNSYEIALAGLREAQDAYGRMKKLHDANALPDMQWVSVQEKLKQAEAAASIARTAMNDANIYTPMSGVVSRKLADVGQTVAPGIPVVELMDVATLKVKISVPESDIHVMNPGLEATVSVGDNGSRKYKAVLTEKGVAANSLSRNYDIKFRISDPDGGLTPGMICNVSVAGVNTGAGTVSVSEIVLPPNAVVLDWDNSSYVWIKKNGVAVRQKVETAGLDSRGIIIKSGVAAGDSIIVEGQQKLSSGLEVVSEN